MYVFDFDFRAIVTFGQDPKDGKEGTQMMFKVRFHIDCVVLMFNG